MQHEWCYPYIELSDSHSSNSYAQDIIEKVKIAIVANMGEGAAPLLLGSGSGDANSIWEDEKYFVLSMM